MSGGNINLATSFLFRFVFGLFFLLSNWLSQKIFLNEFQMRKITQWIHHSRMRYMPPNEEAIVRDRPWRYSLFFCYKLHAQEMLDNAPRTAGSFCFVFLLLFCGRNVTHSLQFQHLPHYIIRVLYNLRSPAVIGRCFQMKTFFF
jgi:hypothetical protein